LGDLVKFPTIWRIVTTELLIIVLIACICTLRLYIECCGSFNWCV